MTEVIPGIRQLKIPLPEKTVYMGYVNVYLVHGDSGYLLVDTGWSTEEAFDSLKSQLAGLGVRIEDISQLVSTHFHPDHYGLAGRLKQIAGTRIALHDREIDLIDTRYIHMDTLLQRVAHWLHINGVPDTNLADLQMASVDAARFVAPTIPDVILYGGETISAGPFNFKVIWTAGHSPGHICLYEPERKVLLSGDHILPTITPNVGLHPQSSENPLGDYINSLNAIKPLDIELVLPGHENPFTDPRLRIEEIIGHHEHRNSEILETIQAEPMTAYQVANEITWMPDAGGINWQDLGPRNKRLAVLETVAHLEYMRVGGRISKINKNGFTYYHL